ncbi:hypothetical protein SAMN02910289_00992 [Lachnospiraceae bacterium RM5]|nr:hypothetical protein SAMN02910289_00992 [Lachnospiraceae bacterium RM5]
MKNNYIYTRIRRIALFNIIVGFAIALIIGIVVYLIPFKEILNPKNISMISSAASSYESGMRFVEVNVKGAKYTGYDYKEQGKVKGHYYYYLVNNTCVFILKKAEKNDSQEGILSSKNIQCRLKTYDKTDKKMMKKFADDIGWEYTNLEKIAPDIIIDELAYHRNLYYYMSIAVGLIFLFCITIIVINILFIFCPWLYPYLVSFIRLAGNKKQEVLLVNEEIENDVILKNKNMIVTKHYFIVFNNFKIDIAPLNKIIWVYKKEISRFGFWKNKYTMNILCKKGMHIVIDKAGLEKTDDMIDFFRENYPNIMVGYSAINKKKAKKMLEKHK